MRRRIALGTLVVAVTAAAVPALAGLIAPRVAPAQPQVSINTIVPAFTVVGLVPGDAMTRCLRVRNEGEEAIALQDGAVVSGALAPYLRFTVERGTGLGDIGPSCTGFAPSGAYAYATKAGGVPATSLKLDGDPSWGAHQEKSLRVTVALPQSAPNAAMAKQATITFAFAGFPLQDATSGGGTGTGIATGTAGGYDKNGRFLTNAQIKKRLRIGRAKLLRNGNVVVKMRLPAGGAIRAKVILAGNRYYAHTLLPEEWGPTLRIVLRRRTLGLDAVRGYRRSGRRLVARVTTRYRWAHGPDAFVQPEQKLVLVAGRR